MGDERDGATDDHDDQRASRREVKTECKECHQCRNGDDSTTTAEESDDQTQCYADKNRLKEHVRNLTVANLGALMASGQPPMSC